MAHYATLFACVLPVGSPENVQRAYDAFARYADHLQLDEDVPAFCITHDPGTSELLITSGEGSGDPDQVAAYVGIVGRDCGLGGLWGSSGLIPAIGTARTDSAAVPSSWTSRMAASSTRSAATPG